MAAENIYQELKDALDEFKSFLDDNIGTIQPAFHTLIPLIPPVKDMIDELIELLEDLKAEIGKLDLSAIGAEDLDKAVEFAEKTKTALEAAKNLVPGQTGTIDDVLGIANVVGSLPSLEDIKAEIIALFEAIITHVKSLKPV